MKEDPPDQKFTFTFADKRVKATVDLDFLVELIIEHRIELNEWLDEKGYRIMKIEKTPRTIRPKLPRRESGKWKW
jgi:hypothetical protein